ncbi:MAG: TlpA family protein disulfide reductase [Ideonella sp.]|nr:TlpA family protein disulfide reductase [Ideonella sp.]
MTMSRGSAAPGATAQNPAMPPSPLTRRTLLCTLAAGGLPWAPGVQAAGEPSPERRPWPRGRPAPPVDLPTLDGAPWRLAGRRGRVVALNFWASWCAPCREEMPSLERMTRQHAASGLEVVALNYKEHPAAIGRYLAEAPLALPVLRDAEGLVARAFEVRIFPRTVFIGRDGRVAFTVVGAADWDAAPARDWVRALL